jgi:hypothetical protein
MRRYRCGEPLLMREPLDEWTVRTVRVLFESYADEDPDGAYVYVTEGPYRGRGFYIDHADLVRVRKARHDRRRGH